MESWHRCFASEVFCTYSWKKWPLRWKLRRACWNHVTSKNDWVTTCIAPWISMNVKEASRIWEMFVYRCPWVAFFHSHSRFCVTLFFFTEDFESHHGHCVANLSQLFADGGSRGSHFRWPPTRELGFLAETFNDQTLNWCDHTRETLFHFKSW